MQKFRLDPGRADTPVLLTLLVETPFVVFGTSRNADTG